MIIINFKNYVVGRKALKLAKLIEKYLPRAIIAVNELDIFTMARKTKLEVFAQHVDYFKTDRATGFVIPENLKKVGAKGSLLNHSEHRLSEGTIERTVKRVNEVGLKSVLCVEGAKQAGNLKFLKPWAMAYEDFELVASGRSITQYKIKEIEGFVSELKRSRILPLCGAGIHSKWDLIAAKEMGCRGVLVSSAVANVRNPKEILKELGRF